MKALKIVTAGVLALALVACESGREKETLGALLGAAAGALIGSQIGSGAGQAAAIGLGAAIGGLAGSQLGKALDDRDRELASAAAARAVTRTPAGSNSTWVNPDSGNSGAYTPIDEPYANADGATCRKVQSTYTIEGESYDGESTICEMADGSVQVVG